MTSEARKSFSKEIEALRLRQGRVEFRDLARLVSEAGLSLADALDVFRDHSGPGHGHIRSRGSKEPLGVLFASLLSQKKSGTLLECTGLPFLLTEQLTNSAPHRLSLIVQNKLIAGFLRSLVKDMGPSFIPSIESLSPETKFNSIVCAPRLGLRPDEKGPDGSGDEIVRKLVQHLAPEGSFYWVTGRAVLWRSAGTLSRLGRQGFSVHACIEIGLDAFPGRMTEGAIIVLRRAEPKKRFAAALRDLETAEPTAAAFLAGPVREAGPNWIWLDPGEIPSFSAFEQSRLLQKLTPRGRHTMQPLGTLLQTDKIEKADRPIAETGQAAAFLYVPEYAGSRVTADLTEQTVKPSAVYRLVVDPVKANPRFLSQLLNSRFGKHLRAKVASGATIQRLSPAALLALEVPLPNMTTQDRLARVGGDFGLLQAAFQEMQGILDQDWSALPEIAEKIDELKAVLDIERRIADWWRELPYPLATIYRRYRVSADAKERLETLLHFFEMAAIYLAVLGASYVKALRADWDEVIPRWLHPVGLPGIERADFGFWISLAGASLKDTSRIASDSELRTRAIEIGRPRAYPAGTRSWSLGQGNRRFGHSPSLPKLL